MTSNVGSTARINVSVADGIATVHIDNPARRNALTREMCVELVRVMPELDADASVLLIAVRGVGANFSAGAALGELAAVLMDRDAEGGRVDHLSRADAAIHGVAKPTVALVDGVCMGGGWQLASACDFILASDQATFAITPAKLGVIYPRLGVERLVRQLGPDRAKYLLFTGFTFSADRAHALGLIADVFSAEDFDATCRSLMNDMRDRSQYSIHTLKRLVNLTGSVDPNLEFAWADAWEAMAVSPDMQIGIDAFLDRLPARFSWRPRTDNSARSE